MARTSKETYGKLLEQLGYEQHALTKTLYTMVVNGKKYGVDIKGREPDVFRLDGTERVNDISDEVVRNTNSVLIGTAEPTKERAPPVNLESEQEYCNATPEVSEDETSTELPREGEEVDVVEIPPSGSTEQADVADYDDDYVNEEPIEVIEPEYAEPEVKKTKETETKDSVEVITYIKNMDIQLAEVGKIKIGKKGEFKTTRTGKTFQAPEKLDHFVIVKTERDPKTGNFIVDEEVMKALGPEPKRIPICLPYDKLDLNFQSSYARFSASKCLCRGDGIRAKLADGSYVPCDPHSCPSVKDKSCKPSGVLSVILEDAPRLGGVYKFRTTSWNSIRNITASLILISTITGGTLRGIPLYLTVAPKVVNVPGMNTTTTIHMANIEYPGSMREMREMAKEEARLRADIIKDIKTIEANAMKQLTESMTPEETKEYTEEFYPELYNKVKQ